MSYVLSIVICTYERPELLQDCLNSLSKQSDQAFDLIVVDNGPGSQMREICARYLENNPSWSYRYSAEVGLSHARNLGYSLAKTKWVGYLDDDAIVASDFIANVKVVIGEDKFDAFGGIYDPWYRDGRKTWFSDLYGTNRRSYKPLAERILRNGEFFSGGIAFYKTQLLKDSRGFDPEFGMTGNKVAYGEEGELQNRIRNHARLGIAPTVTMKHLVAKHKQTLKWQILSHFAKGRFVGKTISSNRGLLSEITRSIPKSIMAGLRSCRSDFGSRSGYLLGVFVGVARAFSFELGVITSRVAGR